MMTDNRPLKEVRVILLWRAQKQLRGGVPQQGTRSADPILRALEAEIGSGFRRVMGTQEGQMMVHAEAIDPDELGGV